MQKRIVQHINLLRRENISKFSLWGWNAHCCLGVLAFSTNAERKQSTGYYCWTGYRMSCRVICAWCLTRGPYGPSSVQYHFIGTSARCHSSEEQHWWQWSSWRWGLGDPVPHPSHRKHSIGLFLTATVHHSMAWSNRPSHLVFLPCPLQAHPCLVVQHTTPVSQVQDLCV